MGELRKATDKEVEAALEAVRTAGGRLYEGRSTDDPNRQICLDHAVGLMGAYKRGRLVHTRDHENRWYYELAPERADEPDED